MLTHILIGSSLAFSAAVQPGPLQAYLLSRVSAIGWRRTLPAAFAPLLSDGPIALLALLILGNLSPDIQNLLRLAGGVLLLVLAWGSFRQWRQPQAEIQPASRVPRTFLEAALVNLLNPNPYLGWTLILGPAIVTAWQEAPLFGVSMVIAFYTTLITTTLVLIYVFGSMRFLGTRIQRRLLLASALMLALLGIYQLLKGAQIRS